MKNIHLQSDGKIIIVGNFTRYDGFEKSKIARLHNIFVGVENFTNNNLNVYPHPASNQIIIESEILSKPNTFITITSLSGKLIYSQMFENLENTQVIAVNKLKNGIYILNVSNGEKTINKKFIVQH